MVTTFQIYRTAAACRTTFLGLVRLKRAVTKIGLPTGQWLLVLVDFSRFGLFFQAKNMSDEATLELCPGDCYRLDVRCVGDIYVLPCLPRRRCTRRAGKDCARILRAGAILPMGRSGDRRAGRADRVGNVPPWIKADFRAPWKRKRTGRLAVRPGFRMRRATRRGPWRAVFFMAPLIVDRIKRPLRCLSPEHSKQERGLNRVSGILEGHQAIAPPGMLQALYPRQRTPSPFGLLLI